jgi:hypothetical protein
VLQTLGPEFDVLTVEFSRGSIDVLLTLKAVGTIYMGVSRWESFIKSMNLLVSQLRNLLLRFFGEASRDPASHPLTVTGSWEPAPVVIAANQVLSASTGFDCCYIVLAYLLLSHAALLGVVVRHLKRDRHHLPAC